MTHNTAESSYNIFDHLPCDHEHCVHEFLSVAEVCALRSVSKSWNSRVNDALRNYKWDVKFREDDDIKPHTWLENLLEASVNIRSIDMVRRRKCACFVL